MQPLNQMKFDIESRGLKISQHDWGSFGEIVNEVNYRKGECIFDMDETESPMLFVAAGIASANMLSDTGRVFIYRFFEQGHLCTRISSAWLNSGHDDTIECVTDLSGVLIPFDYWKKEYLQGNGLGEYFRQKCLEALLFAKDVIRIKTLSQTRVAYEFLANEHKTVVQQAPQKTIAKFIGITPEAMNRFLRGYRKLANDKN
ncbi:MAG: hypothetical protein AAF578_09785 [Pseudomonadota bacterium]